MDAAIHVWRCPICAQFHVYPVVAKPSGRVLTLKNMLIRLDMFESVAMVVFQSDFI
jgi:hypothetical protein